ncbi:aminoglycoside phosphotransferase family protein [Legionella sp. CNM-4043-24]|uniref:aminoglycoside phosphotransferase family protein n=1 Tax=Legionella sp. CNM-4043-24 TaxID=3421646 RepID=UPI00403A8C33
MELLEKNINNQYGEKGKQWLVDLPKRVRQIEAALGLSDLKAVNNLSYNYVMSGKKGMQPVILKLGLDIHGLKREAMALKAFDGFGAVKVLAEDEGMLLLECAIPGVSLKPSFPVRDNEAIRIACDCLNHLHNAPIPADNRFPHIKAWLAALDKDWEIPSHLLQRARKLRDNLLQTSARDVLLHGDLHHDNILQDSEGWIAIDPKGVRGEPAFEVAAFIRNPIAELVALDTAVLPIIQNRIRCFSKFLSIPEQTILDWCFVQAVLAWVWMLEDAGEITWFKQLTEIFDRARVQ